MLSSMKRSTSNESKKQFQKRPSLTPSGRNKTASKPFSLIGGQHTRPNQRESSQQNSLQQSSLQLRVDTDGHSPRSYKEPIELQSPINSKLNSGDSSITNYRKDDAKRPDISQINSQFRISLTRQQLKLKKKNARVQRAKGRRKITILMWTVPPVIIFVVTVLAIIAANGMEDDTETYSQKIDILSRRYWLANDISIHWSMIAATTILQYYAYVQMPGSFYYWFSKIVCCRCGDSSSKLTRKG